MSNNPKRVWQQQPEGTPTMTLETIHWRATQLEEQTRRELLRNIAVPVLLVAVIVIGGFHLGLAQEPLQQGAYVAAIAWALAGQYFLHRGMWDAGAAPGAGIELYRREIERQLSLFRRALRWSLGPIFLAIGAFVVPLLSAARTRGLLQNTFPFFTLLVGWIVAVFVLRSQRRRDLQRELTELERLEKRA